MNGPVVNDRDELEYELSDQLRRRANQVLGRTDPKAWDAIHERIRRRHRARQVRRTVGTMAAMVVLVAGLFSLVSRNGTGDGGVTAATPSPATGDAGGLPHLVVALPGYEINHASEYVPGVANGAPASIPTDIPPPDAVGSVTGDLRLSVLAEPDRGYDGRVLFVTSVAPAVPFGFGESNPDARTLTIGGRPAYLGRLTGLPATSLGWKLADGRGLYLIGLRLTDDELVAAGMAVRDGGGGSVTWEEGSMPAGLALERMTVTPTGSRHQSEVAASRDGNRMDLRLQAGDEDVLDDLIRDRAASALEIGSTEVGGAPAVTIVYELGDQTTLMWMVRPGVVAELVGSGSARADLLAAANSLREIDDAEWASLVIRFSVTGRPFSDGSPNGIVVEICQTRSVWLAARERGDGALEERAVTGLRELLHQSTLNGAGSDSDILVQLKALIDAMDAGKVDVVKATPAGACSGG